jgi:hypothetical protein
MAHAFRPRRDGTVACKLEQEERAVIAQVAQEVTDLIRTDLGLEREPGPIHDASQSEDPLQRLEAELASREPREPRDSAVARLFPAASEDPTVAAEFRRLGQQHLVDQKLSDLQRIQQSLDGAGRGLEELVLDPDEAVVWMRSLNDLRLVLADRLSITQDGEFGTLRMLQQIGRRVPDAPPVDEDPETAGSEVVAEVYELLTWLQDGLIRSIEVD